MDKRFFDHMLTVNNGRRSQLSSKVSDELFEKEYGESQKNFCKYLFEICRKEQTSVEKVFFILFSFHLLLVCLLQFMFCCLLLSQARIEK